eukprot:CAMPEP_0174698308 /NCGR_PEP_ID=MMETSP1094-20130205/3932_1 /TAXON_ID=156173 /ORGANISM="Chrysochromulina brevifilum, Strain UTEX LB 985" /LENGTH=71 /DNA_ID=CAMNT_0015895447 /DNA_START=73 /DNA_END=288 /DNA_ORIENTATION=-
MKEHAHLVLSSQWPRIGQGQSYWSYQTAPPPEAAPRYVLRVLCWELCAGSYALGAMRQELCAGSYVLRVMC